MEVFSLLKYWRSSGTTATTTSTTTTIRPGAVADCATDENNHHEQVVVVGDDGPFFDLEFSLPPEEDITEQESENEEDDEGEGEEDEFDFTVDSFCSTGNRTDPNLSLSPSDDLFFNSRFVPLEPSELGFNSTESHSKLGSLLRPATKLRVLMLGFKKPKSTEKVEKQSGTSNNNKSCFTVKLKVEEVPIVSLLSRDTSSRMGNKLKPSSEEIASDEKKFAKDVLHKYLKMVKPLYLRVSKKTGDKFGFSGQLMSLNSSTSPISSSPRKKLDGELKQESNVKTTTTQKEGNLTAGLRNVRKHLGKSRSASSSSSSSAVAAIPLAAQSRRHDDSLLQQQDGIQSAILHCKRSFTASRDSDSSELSRCTSDPSHEEKSAKKDG